MTNTPKLSVLPDDTAQNLIALKDSSPDEFYALVYALKSAGWTLRAIAEPFGVSRTAVAQWVRKHPGTETPAVPPVPARPKLTRKRTEAYILSAEEVSELRELAEHASTVRRFTDAKSPSRKAAAKLEEKLSRYVNLGVTKRKLAEHCRVSESSIKQRLRKL